MTTESLDQLVMSRRVLITVGAGGVGKTTTAAALGVAAACRGRRVLCLTIDPAKRLAEALGLQRMSSEEQSVGPELFARAGIRFSGSLTAMMLDTKRTFDDLVHKYSSSPERAEKLLSNRLYQYVSTSLAGTQEYMAMEKLVAVQRDPRFDLIILDTPPTANALDFLDAPMRLIDALDSTTMRWFLQAFESTGKLSLNLLARSAALVLRGLGRITGGTFLQDMAGLIADLNDLFGGFRQRAVIVQEALKSPDVSFVLVTSPAPPSIDEVLFFNDRLVASSMPRGAFVVNRFRVAAGGEGAPSEADVIAAVERLGLRLEEGGAARLLHAHADVRRLAALDALHVDRLRGRVEGAVPIVRVPDLPTDVRDLPSLSAVATTLMSGGV
jgi:anion-transporting  ArsA/GET3 family ATPase